MLQTAIFFDKNMPYKFWLSPFGIVRSPTMNYGVNSRSILQNLNIDYVISQDLN